MLADLLEGRALEFSYQPPQRTICGVSISVRQGSMTAMIGANGCGKSTLIRLLAGILQPVAGSVAYRGRVLAETDRRALARQLAYVPQNSSRAFPFTALEVVLTGRTPHTPPFRLENLEDGKRALQALERVGVGHLAQRRITELSGGERQMVAVARALAQGAECMLLDEPAASLDLKHRASLIRLLRDLQRESGMTTVMITHDLSLLEPGFDRVVAMRCGSIVADGTPAEVLCDSTLADIYDDRNIRARRVEGRMCVWSEVGA